MNEILRIREVKFIFIALLSTFFVGCGLEDPVYSSYPAEIQNEIYKIDSSFNEFVERNYKGNLKLFLSDIMNSNIDINKMSFMEYDSLLAIRYENHSLSQLANKFDYESGYWRFDTTKNYFHILKRYARVNKDDTAKGYVGRIRQIGGLSISSISTGLLDKLEKNNDEEIIRFISTIELYYPLLSARFEKRNNIVKGDMDDYYQNAYESILESRSLISVVASRENPKINIRLYADNCPIISVIKDSISNSEYNNYIMNRSPFEMLEKTPFRVKIPFAMRNNKYQNPDATLFFSRICEGYLSTFLINGDGEVIQEQAQFLFKIVDSELVKLFEESLILETWHQGL